MLLYQILSSRSFLCSLQSMLTPFPPPKPPSSKSLVTSMQLNPTVNVQDASYISWHVLLPSPSLEHIAHLVSGPCMTLFQFSCCLRVTLPPVLLWSCPPSPTRVPRDSSLHALLPRGSHLVTAFTGFLETPSSHPSCVRAPGTPPTCGSLNRRHWYGQSVY